MLLGESTSLVNDTQGLLANSPLPEVAWNTQEINYPVERNSVGGESSERQPKGRRPCMADPALLKGVTAEIVDTSRLGTICWPAEPKEGCQYLTNHAARRVLRDAGLPALFRRGDGEWT
jgi:hypothetical protein